MRKDRRCTARGAQMYGHGGTDVRSGGHRCTAQGPRSDAWGRAYKDCGVCKMIVIPKQNEQISKLRLKDMLMMGEVVVFCPTW